MPFRLPAEMTSALNAAKSRSETARASKESGAAALGAVPAEKPPRDASATGQLTPVEVNSWSCATLADAEPQGIGMTVWIDSADGPTPPVRRLQFIGRRAEGEGAAPSSEPASFTREVTVAPVPAGAGPFAVTARVTGIPRGTWDVHAVALDERGRPCPRRMAGAGMGQTTFGPLVRVLAPGVRPFAWPSLVLLGTMAALVIQTLLSRSRELPAGRLLAVSLAACMVGALGAKAYYLITHRGAGGPLAAGMSIQGFVLAAVSTLGLGLFAVGVPLAEALDVTTPGMLTGMAIGRLGCWFGGCCAGRPTASRWGLWSSDRALGVRRIPVQFAESAMTAILAAITALLVVSNALGVSGAVFVIGIGSYTLGRQVLFPLRDIPRSTTWGRPVVTAVATTAIVLAAVVGVVG